MRTIFHIFYGIFIGLLVLVGGLFVLSMVQIPGGVQMKIVQSGSMQPSIPVGSLVVLKPVESYRVGDVITFMESRGAEVPTTHRVVSVRNGAGRQLIQTKGDANEEADQREIASRDVLGKVFLSVPGAGFVLDFARQPLGFLLLIGLPAFLIIVSELSNILQEILRTRPRRPVVLNLRARQRSASAHVRRFATDDIFIPKRSAGAMSYTHISSLVFAVAIGSFTFSFNSGGTLSYFRDTELSSGNSFTAASSFTTSISSASAGPDAPLFTEEVGPLEDETPTPESPEPTLPDDSEAPIESGAEEVPLDVEVREPGEQRWEETREERGERELRSETTQPEEAVDEVIETTPEPTTNKAVEPDPEPEAMGGAEV